MDDLVAAVYRNQKITYAIRIKKLPLHQWEKLNMIPKPTPRLSRLPDMWVLYWEMLDGVLRHYGKLLEEVDGRNWWPTQEQAQVAGDKILEELCAQQNGEKL
jgi:hypothetical protein